MLGNFACFLSSVDFFFKLIFSKKNLLGIPSVYQTVWVQIRLDILSGLIWVQTVCKGYQQMTKVTAGGKRFNCINFFFSTEQVISFHGISFVFQF